MRTIRDWKTILILTRRKVFQYRRFDADGRAPLAPRPCGTITESALMVRMRVVAIVITVVVAMAAVIVTIVTRAAVTIAVAAAR